jgi:hypothetical protein
MDRKFTLVIIITISIVSFFGGKYSAVAEKNAEYLDALVTTSNFANDRWGDVKLIEALYESTQEESSIAKNQFILAVALIYRDDVRTRDVFNSDYGLNTGTYGTNKAVIEFLEKHGFSSCKELKNIALVACNLDAVENEV